MYIALMFALLFSAQSLYGAVPYEHTSLVVEPPVAPSNQDPNAIPQNQLAFIVSQQRVGVINYCSYRSNPTLAGLYHFYIDPEYRGRGHAKTLLRYTIDYLGNRGFKKVIVLPGPFEFKDGKAVDMTGEQREQALKSLIKLYKWTGFTEDPAVPENLVYHIPEKTYRGYIFFLLGVLAVAGLAYGIWRFATAEEQSERH